MINAQESIASTLTVSRMTNSATVTANWDLRGGSYGVLSVILAAEINTNATGPTISVLESDASGSGFVTVTADRTAEDITSAKTIKYLLDARSRKRFIRVSVTTAGTTNDDVTVAAVGELSRNDSGPAEADLADVVVLV